jgi:RNA polymerase sigma factor (sigma-70 family)
MDPAGPRSHLTRISTPWTLVRRAHGGAGDCAAHAQRLLLQRYCGAAYRYLRGALRDEEATLDLLQEFVLRFLRGDFRRADPGSGRFRDYLKAALIYLVADYHRQQRAQPRPLPADIDEQAVAPDGAESEATFLQSWREELINRTRARGQAPAGFTTRLARYRSRDSRAARLRPPARPVILGETSRPARGVKSF